MCACVDGVFVKVCVSARVHAYVGARVRVFEKIPMKTLLTK